MLKNDRSGQGNSLLYGLYRILGTVVHGLLAVAAPLLQQLLPDWQIAARLGRTGDVARDPRKPLIWIHAASVGEVQAARALLVSLMDRQCGCSFFLTTMTLQGREVARSQLPEDVYCRLAPLDTPQAVARMLRTVQPDMYICLETELWPVMLTRTRQAGIPMLLLNGRMSERSCRQYRRMRGTMAKLLSGFAGFAVIREQDGARYRSLGAPAERTFVCGNMKYDLQVEDPRQLRRRYQRILQLDTERVFICGSTRSGEEELLLPVYNRLRQEAAGLLWIIAPRHLSRLGDVEAMLAGAGLEYDLLSDCAQRGRSAEIVLVDSMGELANLYSVGEYIFCGGSLVDKGGHNIMEPVRLHKPVCFGPFMKDFRDAAELVLSAGAGFQVENADDLTQCLLSLMRDPDQYQRACRLAADLALLQQGAVQRQADMVIELLAA